MTGGGASALGGGSDLAASAGASDATDGAAPTANATASETRDAFAALLESARGALDGAALPAAVPQVETSAKGTTPTTRPEATRAEDDDATTEDDDATSDDALVVAPPVVAMPLVTVPLLPSGASFETAPASASASASASAPASASASASAPAPASAPASAPESARTNARSRAPAPAKTESPPLAARYRAQLPPGAVLSVAPDAPALPPSAPTPARAGAAPAPPAPSMLVFARAIEGALLPAAGPAQPTELGVPDRASLARATNPDAPVMPTAPLSAPVAAMELPRATAAKGDAPAAARGASVAVARGARAAREPRAAHAVGLAPVAADRASADEAVPAVEARGALDVLPRSDDPTTPSDVTAHLVPGALDAPARGFDAPRGPAPAPTSGAVDVDPRHAQRQAMVDRSVNHVALRGAVEGSLTSADLGTVRVAARERDGSISIAVHAARPEAETQLRVEQSAIVRHVEAANLKVDDLAIRRDDRVAALDATALGGGTSGNASGGSGGHAPERDRDDSAVDVDPSTSSRPSSQRDRGRVRFVL